MTTITLHLPDDLAKQVESKGLLTDAALVAFLRQALRDDEVGIAHGEGNPPGFDPRFTGKASPALMGSVKINGDLVAPLSVQWEADS